jgi:hypothetical protein
MERLGTCMPPYVPQAAFLELLRELGIGPQ